MGFIEDLIKALERIPAWKRVNELPAQVAALEARLQALEARFEPAAGNQCPKCRSMTFMFQRSEPAAPPWDEMGLRLDHYACSQCGHTGEIERRPK